MSRPLRMWCVKTPRGRLLEETVCPRKNGSIWRSGDTVYIPGRRPASIHDHNNNWNRLMAEGYTVVRVTVEEEG